MLHEPIFSLLTEATKQTKLWKSQAINFKPKNQLSSEININQDLLGEQAQAVLQRFITAFTKYVLHII